jgi:intracellular sulfur oxidation DsrE/DsrF family protein
MGFLLTGVRAIVCDTSMVRLRDDVKQLLAHVEATDAGEDAQYDSDTVGE